MLEVDEDSRLGSELLAHGSRYGATTVPSDDETADWYAAASEWLTQAGVAQYEISNFARPGFASRHNLKYWTRDPYLGFGLDAHSMLRNGVTGVRWANTDSLDHYLAHEPPQGRELNNNSPLRLLPSPVPLPELTQIDESQAFDESLFLGLRRNAGVELAALEAEFNPTLVRDAVAAADDAIQGGLLELTNGYLRLTSAGRMVSNEVFARLLLEPAA
jgi:oxygen-independent coproporphyrinogen-3 oxidase